MRPGGVPLVATRGDEEKEGQSVKESDVGQFYEALGQGDFEWLGARLHDEVVLEFPGRRFGGRFEVQA